MSGRGFGGESGHRRRYRIGRRCQDCGWDYKPTTRIEFWASGMEYYVCSECIEPYRRVISHARDEWRRP